MGKIRKILAQFQFKGILGIAVVFLCIAGILLVELAGVQVHHTSKELELLKKEQVITKEMSWSKVAVDTLVLWNSSEETSVSAMEEFKVILKDMKVGYQVTDLSKEKLTALQPYRVVIVLLADLTVFGNELTSLCQWVAEGGQALLPLTLEQNAYFASLSNKIGIQSYDEYAVVNQIYIQDGFMVGGGKTYVVTDGYDSARMVRLDEKGTTTYAATEEGGIPLVWECDYGKGKFVVDNFGVCDKAYRGLYAASLSLLTEVYVYPVINGSVFYLDDFPSQIPGGSNPYITRDYDTTVRDFYLNIWWPDMLNLADKYGLKYTGLAVMCYDNIVDGTTPSQADKLTFTELGNMLLRKGGEIGYHGYNHQPLALGNKGYDNGFDYKTWDSYDAMHSAFQTLIELCDEIFPNVELSVYVPPSNLLTEEGRAMLMKEFPHIRTYSGIYFPDEELDFSLIQEFEVDENGVVDQPRIISGCDIDDFMQMGALSELNLHYVNDHFTHPDDALDPDRGAELGWAELKKRFDGFLDWLYGNAKELRNLTGTEMSAAVQRFVAVSPQRELQENRMTLRLEHFYDEAQFLIRFNEKEPGNVIGGKLTPLTGNLYLLEAEKETVTIDLK